MTRRRADELVVERAAELVDAWRSSDADWVMALYGLEDAVDAMRRLIGPAGTTEPPAAPLVRPLACPDRSS